MKTRTDVLNHLARKHNLQRYLEIGVQVPELNFDKIQCEYKVGVDPDPKAKATFCMTSDDFFDINTPEDKIDVTTIEDSYSTPGGRKYMTIDRRLDLIFIDGLHTAEQVAKDFRNAIKFLSPKGFIVLHDCNPEKEEHTIVPRPTPTGHWNGDVYKFASSMRKYPYWTVDIDNGCMVVRPDKDYFDDGIEWPKYTTWKFFDENRKELLNLISWDEFVSL